jgi:hypothetical protein
MIEKLRPLKNHDVVLPVSMSRGNQPVHPTSPVKQIQLSRFI